MSTLRAVRFNRHRPVRRPVFQTLESRTFLSAGLLGDDALETASHAPVSAEATAAGKADPLGGNLNLQGDRVQDHPFTDLVRTTRGFYNLAGRLASNGKPALANTTPEGWPTEAFMFSVADNAEYGVPIDAGVYKMSFKGPAAVTPTIRRTAPAGAGTVPANAPLPTLTKTGYDAATGIHTYDVNVPQGVLTLAFEFRNTSGSVRDLKVLQPGYSLANFPTFSNEYVNLLNNLSPNVLRMMDWTAANNNPVVNWADRTKTTDATQAKVGVAGDLVASKGIAWEYVIQLANQLDKDVWINIPAKASDDYINNLATLFRDTLEAGRDIYVEYSNEVWNTVFTQSTHNTDQAKAEVAANPNSNLKDGGTTNTTTWADRRYARETKEISDRFKSVWIAGGKANPINSQVKVVLGGQYGNLSRFDNELSYLNKFYGKPSDSLYGIGIAPYINLSNNQSVEGLTKDQVLTSLRNSLTAMTNGTGLASTRTKANTWGLQMTAYEGGIDTFGPTSIAAKRAAVLDPAIQQIVADYLDLWYDRGGNQFNWVTLGARSFNSINGTWSITEDIRNYNQPKELAFKAVRDLGRGVTTTSATPATLSINDVSANEGNSSLTPFGFTVTRGGDTSGTTTATFTVQAGTAGGGDVQIVSGPVGFGPGETSKQVVVNVVGDTSVEQNETFAVVLSGASGGTIADGSGTGTIVNDDSTGGGTTTLSIADASKNEGNSGTSLLAFTVTRGGTTTGSTTVNYATQNSSAGSGDYEITSGSVSFSAGQTSKSINITIKGDTKVEANETFFVNLSAASGGASISDAQATGTIVNDDGVTSTPSTISINDVSANEGNSGPTGFAFTATRSGSTAGTTTANFAVQAQTADGTDVQLVSGPFGFGPGETTKQIVVNVNGDTTVESNETFLVVLSGVAGGAIGDGSGTGTIVNDDTGSTPPPPTGAMPLGGNLQFQTENTRDHAFADLVKATSGFKNLSGGSASLDTSGWPTQDFTVPLWSGQTMDVGNYAVSFSGSSNTVVSLNGGKGTITKGATSGSTQNYTINIPTSTSALSLKFTGTSGQVKNLKVIQPGMSSTQVWSTHYVNHLKSLKPDTLRPMDMVKANHNLTSSWSQAPKTTDANYAKNGVPWEHLIDLANTVGSNIWVTIPVAATDDYVRQLAAMLKTRLASTLRVYVEIGNEVWSNATANGKFNTDQAKAEVANNSSSNLDYDGSTNSERWSERRYARRMMQVSNLFKEVWTTTFNGTTAQANPINNRVRVILGGQATESIRLTNMLEYINSQYGAPKNFFYGTALAWYFGLNKYADKFNPGSSVTKEQVLEGMNLSVSAYENEQRFKSPANQAAQWGLKLHAYEIGVDTFGSLNVAAKAAASNDIRISGLMQRMVNAFKNQGGEAAEWFQLGAATYQSNSGTWAVTENIKSLNTPKQQGYRILRGLTATV